MLTRPALSLIEVNSFRGTQDGSASYQVFTNTLDVECPARNKVHHVCPQEGNKIEGWRSRPQLRAKGAEQPVHECEVQRDRVGLGKEGSFQPRAWLSQPLIFQGIWSSARLEPTIAALHLSHPWFFSLTQKLRSTCVHVFIHSFTSSCKNVS